MNLKEGELWNVDGRKGPMIIQLMEDVDTEKDMFFKAKVLEGKAMFASIAYNYEQKENGYGLPGSVITLRSTLTSFIERAKGIWTEDI